MIQLKSKTTIITCRMSSLLWIWCKLEVCLVIFYHLGGKLAVDDATVDQLATGTFLPLDQMPEPAFLLNDTEDGL